MSQLPLPIDWRQTSQSDEVVVGIGNRTAIDFLLSPGLWPSHCAILAGPERSGRSTIAADVARQGIAGIVDDADREDETALFHLWNRTREEGRRLLLVAGEQWAVALPDLRSRLATAGIARILAPDEDMIEAMIVQGLAQGGAAHAADVPRYLAPRLPRCYRTVELAITALNAASLSSGSKISVATARQCLLAEAIFSPR